MKSQQGSIQLKLPSPKCAHYNLIITVPLPEGWSLPKQRQDDYGWSQSVGKTSGVQFLTISVEIPTVQVSKVGSWIDEPRTRERGPGWPPLTVLCTLIKCAFRGYYRGQNCLCINWVALIWYIFYFFYSILRFGFIHCYQAVLLLCIHL